MYTEFEALIGAEKSVTHKAIEEKKIDKHEDADSFLHNTNSQPNVCTHYENMPIKIY